MRDDIRDVAAGLFMFIMSFLFGVMGGTIAALYDIPFMLVFVPVIALSVYFNYKFWKA